MAVTGRRRLLVGAIALVALGTWIPLFSTTAIAGPPASAFGVDYDGSIGNGAQATWTPAWTASFYLGERYVLYDYSRYDAHSYNNNSGSAAYSNLPGVAVWHWAGHGAAGIAAFYKKKPDNSWIVQTLEATPYKTNSASDPYLNNAVYYLNNLLGADLDDMLIVAFLGCETANYKAGHYGDQKYNLLFLLRNEKYVSNVIGAQGSVYEDTRNYWSNSFWIHGTQGNRYISQAMNYATNDVISQFGWADGTDRIVCVGHATTDKMWPARWGPPGL